MLQTLAALALVAAFDAPPDASPAVPVRVSPDGQHAPIGDWELGAEKLLVIDAQLSEGGEVFTYLSMYWSLRFDDIRVRFDYPCYSACTFALGIIPVGSMCAGPLATFHFHAVYRSDTGEVNAPLTEWVMESIYPRRVRLLLEAEGFKVDRQPSTPDGFISLTRDDLGVPHCPK